MKIFERLSRQSIALLFSLLVLSVALCSSLASEYYFNFTPCRLCLAQRYCVAGCIGCALVALLFKNISSFISKKFLDVTCIVLFWGIIAAGYQLLIQYNILPEPDFCKISLPLQVNLEELEAIIRKNQIISCTNFGPTIFGLPISAFSFVTFSFLFIYLSYHANSKK